MGTKIPLDVLQPWETFKIGDTLYTVILVPLTCTKPTVSCRNEFTQLMENLPRKTRVRRA